MTPARTARAPRRGRHTMLCIALAGAFATPWAAALPVGEAVVAGQVDVSRPTPGSLQMQQHTDRAIVDWRGFSIAPGEAVDIRQPGAHSALLNRVTGHEASTIAGRLSANGQVFLINPAGVLFAPGASVSSGAFVASTLGMSNEDFMAARLHFQGRGGSVINHGNLEARNGTVALLGGQVDNHGVVSAQLGTVALGAGEAITLDFAGDGLTTMRIERAALEAIVRNQGLLSADGGQVLLAARAAEALAASVVNRDGVIAARSLSERDGRIVLDAGGGTLEAGGRIDASGMDAGGGRIDLAGARIAVLDGARIDARGNGAHGAGGNIRIGGGREGRDADIANAHSLWISPNAEANADAGAAGRGGSVVAYATDTARIHGRLSARGGSTQGDGGFVETSAARLDLAGVRVHADAPQGRGGEWLIDPYDITITAAPSTATSPAPDFASLDYGANVAAADIEAQLNSGTSVVVRTTDDPDAANENGNITVLAPIAKTAGGDASLSLIAHGGIIIESGASITADAGRLDLTLAANAYGAPGFQPGVRVGNYAAPRQTTTLRTNGGNLTIGGQDPAAGGYAVARDGAFDQYGAVLVDTLIDTRGTSAPGDGSVAIRGDGGTTHGGGGVLLHGAQIFTGAGDVDIRGRMAGTLSPDTPAGTSFHGVLALTYDDGSAPATLSRIETTSGAIRVYGAATLADPGLTGSGVTLAGATLWSETGDVELRGRVASAATAASPGARAGLELLNTDVRTADAGASIGLYGENTAFGPAVILDDSTIGDTATASDIVLGARSSGGRALALAGSELRTSSSLRLRPAGVADDFALVADHAAPIVLYGNDPGFSLDADDMAQIAPGPAGLVAGGTAHTGRIIVLADCTGGTCAAPVFAGGITLANRGAGSAGIALPAGLDAPGGTIALSSAGPVDVDGALRADGLLLDGPTDFILTDAGNQIARLAVSGAANVDLLNAAGLRLAALAAPTTDATGGRGNLSVPASSVTGNLRARAQSGNIGLGEADGSASHSVSAGGALDLIAPLGVFDAPAGGGLSAGDGWRVWTATWEGETRGGIAPGNPDPNYYGCSADTGCAWGGAVPAGTSHFVYTARPTVTVTAEDASRMQGEANPAFTVNVSPLVNGDLPAEALAGDCTTLADTASPAGSYAITPAYTSRVGYLVNNVAGTLTVTATPPPPPPPSPPDSGPGPQPAPPLPASAAAVRLYAQADPSFVYAANLGARSVCVAAGPSVRVGADGPADVLAREWPRVRTSPNLSNCITLEGRNRCDDF